MSRQPNEPAPQVSRRPGHRRPLSSWACRTYLAILSKLIY